MTGTDPAEVVDFDVESVLSTAQNVVDEALLLCVVYNDREFGTVYVDDRVDALYDDETQRSEHFGQIHDYVHLDFTEQELFDELFLEPNGIRAFVTYMGNIIAVRVVADRQGVFVGVAPGTPVTELVDELEAVLER